jgi:glycosyltransferase involved in cell wall biosynthesis
MSPPPSNRNSIGIFLQRVANELERRHYKVTGKLFHYTGFEVLPWQKAFVFGTPRRAAKINASGKPVVLTIGRPEIKEENEALGFPYLPVHVEQEATMTEAIVHASQVVFISHYVRNVWREIFSRKGLAFPEPRTAVIHHGIDLEFFTPRPEQRAEPFVIGLAGEFRRIQGLVSLFEISRRLQFPHRLMFVGSMTPAYRQVFDEGMKDPGLAARTTFIPWVPAKELPRYYRQMSCFYHPIIGDSFGNVVAEALACGVPVVCPKFGGSAEFVVPDGGIAVDSPGWDCGEVFIAGMEKAISHIHANLEKFSLGARKQAEKLVSIEACVDDYLRLMALPGMAALDKGHSTDHPPACNQSTK